jgi:hypothetical protein
MISRRTFSAALGLVALLVTSGCDSSEHNETYRYRMTLEVETPQGLKTGSGVIQVNVVYHMGIPHSGTRSRIKGEAVAVDIAPGKTLFALLDQPERIVPLAFDATIPMQPRRGSKWPDHVFAHIRTLKSQTAVVTVPERASPNRPEMYAYPKLVTFRDIRDPRSVESVEPGALEKSFGPGVKLRRITVQLTQDDVTTGIKKRLNAEFWKRKGMIHKKALENNGIYDPYFSSLTHQFGREFFEKR